MKKNKIIKYLLFTFIIVGCININGVLAYTVGVYNGSGGSSGNISPANGGCSSGTFCDNASFALVKATLYYIDNGNYSQPFYSEYFSNKTISGLDNLNVNKSIVPSGANGKSVTGYSDINANLKKYFMANDWEEAKKFIEKAGIKDAEDSQPANKNNPAQKGYRIIIEPVFKFNQGGYYQYNTIKYIARHATISKTKRITEKTALWTDFKDVGIATGHSGCTKSEIADYTDGCGMNIIDITEAIEKEYCYFYNQKTSVTEQYEITDCVKQRMKNGEKRAEAKKYCILNTPQCLRTYCPDRKTEITSEELEKYKKYGKTKQYPLAEIDKDCYDITCPCDCYGKQQQLPDKYSLATKNTMKNLIINSSKYTLNSAVDEMKNRKCTDYNKPYACEYDKKNDGELKCIYEFENKGTISNKFTEIENNSKTTSCSSNIAIGTKVTTLGGCDVYCSETSTLTLPGHVKEIIKSGTSFEWPTIGNKSAYRMNINTKITCTVVDSKKDGTRCGNVDVYSFLNKYNYKDDSTVTYDDEDYGKEISLKKKRRVNCKNCRNLRDSNKGKPNRNNTFIISVDTNYQLNDLLNRKIDSNGIYFNSDISPSHRKIKTPALPLLLLNKSALAVSKDAKGYYELQLKLNLGRNAEFATELSDYKCNYKVKNDTDECVCPTGTKNEGKDISHLADCLNKTCTLAQIELCNVDVIDEEKYAKACVCKYNGNTIDLSDCMKEHDFNYCYNKECNQICSNDCKWKITEKKQSVLDSSKTMKKWKKFCKNGDNEEECDVEWTCPGCGDNTPDSCDMNPTPCIQTKLGQRNLEAALKKGWITEEELNRALIACEQVVCPYGGKRIIYRVIDLDDPFPGMTLKGKTNKFTNTSTNGRYPGYNWNNELWVQNKIRKVISPQRNVDNGKNIYNETPLYTIELTPSDIKNIRKYNKTNDYTNWRDFTCENGTCISKFLRTLPEYSKIFTSGLCSNMNTPTQLRQCYESYSSSSALSTYKN